MSHSTPTDLLVLHAVRVLGYADSSRIAARFALNLHEVHEHLQDAQARGWITFSSYAGDEGWSLTEHGKVHGERRLSAELDEARARAAVEEVYRQFMPLNDIVASVCTAWQLAEIGMGAPTVTLARTVAALEQPAGALEDLESRLTAHLERFSGYHHRFSEALARASAQPSWITGTDRDSCHRVWFELHEDLLATLGLTR